MIQDTPGWGKRGIGCALCIAMARPIWRAQNLLDGPSEGRLWLLAE